MQVAKIKENLIKLSEEAAKDSETDTKTSSVVQKEEPETPKIGEEEDKKEAETKDVPKSTDKKDETSKNEAKDTKETAKEDKKDAVTKGVPKSTDKKEETSKNESKDTKEGTDKKDETSKNESKDTKEAAKESEPEKKTAKSLTVQIEEPETPKTEVKEDTKEAVTQDLPKSTDKKDGTLENEAKGTKETDKEVETKPEPGTPETDKIKEDEKSKESPKESPKKQSRGLNKIRNSMMMTTQTPPREVLKDVKIAENGFVSVVLCTPNKDVCLTLIKELYQNDKWLYIVCTDAVIKKNVETWISKQPEGQNRICMISEIACDLQAVGKIADTIKGFGNRIQNLHVIVNAKSETQCLENGLSRDAFVNFFAPVFLMQKLRPRGLRFFFKQKSIDFFKKNTLDIPALSEIIIDRTENLPKLKHNNMLTICILLSHLIKIEAQKAFTSSTNVNDPSQTTATIDTAQKLSENVAENEEKKPAEEALDSKKDLTDQKETNASQEEKKASMDQQDHKETNKPDEKITVSTDLKDQKEKNTPEEGEKASTAQQDKKEATTPEQEEKAPTAQQDKKEATTPEQEIKVSTDKKEPESQINEKETKSGDQVETSKTPEKSSNGKTTQEVDKPVKASDPDAKDGDKKSNVEQSIQQDKFDAFEPLLFHGVVDSVVFGINSKGHTISNFLNHGKAYVKPIQDIVNLIVSRESKKQYNGILFSDNTSMQEISKYLKFNDHSIDLLKKLIEKTPQLLESSDKNKLAQDFEDDIKQLLESIEKVELKPSKKVGRKNGKEQPKSVKSPGSDEKKEETNPKTPDNVDDPAKKADQVAVPENVATGAEISAQAGPSADPISGSVNAETPAPADGKACAPADGGANAPASGGVSAPADGGANAPSNGEVNASPSGAGSSAPADGGSSAPANGAGSSAPADGGSSAPVDGGASTPADGGACAAAV